MEWLEHLLGKGDRTPVRAARWVVIDCETSGLDASHDRLLSLGAVVVHGGRIDLGSAFGAVLRQDRPSDTANILVHGIGGESQLGGRPVREALTEFLAFAGEGIPVAFHAPFDAEVLRRASSAEGLAAPSHWVDAARLAPALFPQAPPAKGDRCSLDDWLAFFGIACSARHDAVGDAYATAQLLLVLLAEAGRQGAQTAGSVRRLERSGRWIKAS
jgi:DNA polymerase III subunit epsilon